MISKWGSGTDKTQKYILLTISPARRMERKNAARLTEGFIWKIKIHLASQQLRCLASQISNALKQTIKLPKFAINKYQ